MKEIAHGPEANLGGIFRLRRDLITPIKNVVLVGTVLSPDKADLLLDLFRSGQGHGESKVDAQGFVSFREVQELVMNSQSHVSRRINELQKESLVEIRDVKRGQQHHANSLCVRISKKGVKVIEPVWRDYRKLAEDLFESVTVEDREIHFRVNQLIRHKLHPYRIDLKRPSTHPVENVFSILKAWKELGPTVRKTVVSESGLTLEKCDLLTDLFGAKEKHWPDPKGDEDGFVTLKTLQASLVHGQNTSQILLSRRIRELEKDGLVEIRKGKASQKNLVERDKVRITARGRTVIEPVWDKYKELAQKLLEQASAKERQAHWRVNETLLQKLRPAWATLL